MSVIPPAPNSQPSTVNEAENSTTCQPDRLPDLQANLPADRAASPSPTTPTTDQTHPEADLETDLETNPKPDPKAVTPSRASEPPLNESAGNPAGQTLGDPPAAQWQQVEQAKQLYAIGRSAVEGGRYALAIQKLEQAAALAPRGTVLNGEVQVWLVTAYQAQGNLDAALSLCRRLTRHPQLETRQQSRRLLTILEAPRLSKRPEWLSQIPDLATLQDGEREARKGATTVRRSRSTRPLPQPEPIDPSTINRQDNQFIWVALGLGCAILLYLAYSV